MKQFRHYCYKAGCHIFMESVPLLKNKKYKALSVENRKTTVLFLIIIAMLPFALAGCSARMGLKPLSEMPKTFWQSNGTVRISISACAGTIGRIKGEINKIGTALNVALFGVIEGFSRYDDEQFYLRVQKLLENRDFSPHKHALAAASRKLNLPSTLTPYYSGKDFWYNYQLTKDTAEPTLPEKDLYIDLTIYFFFEDTTGKFSMSEPTVRLSGMMTCLIMNRETRLRIHQNKPSKTAWSDYLEGAYVSTSNHRTTVNSDSYPKSTWLSEDGRFLEKGIRSIVNRLVYDACQKINSALHSSTRGFRVKGAKKEKIASGSTQRYGSLIGIVYV